MKVFLFALVFLSGLFSSATLALKQGEEAPPTRVRSLQNEQHFFDLKDFKGKVVYVDFWASWCDPCVRSFPFTAQLYKDYHHKDLEILAINLDKRPEDGENFLLKIAERSSTLIQFMIGFDPEGKFPLLYGVEVMPSSYVVDQKGVVHYIHQGFRENDPPKIRKVISGLLERWEFAPEEHH